MKGEENMTYNLKCPYCGDDDVLLMETLDFNFDGDTAYVIWDAKCYHCGHNFIQHDNYSFTDGWAEKPGNG